MAPLDDGRACSKAEDEVQPEADVDEGLEVLRQGARSGVAG